ncbi:MAG: response regulator [Gammaproteobacteria bacterium]|jgi:signal transduction histidine kinase/AmiR/NasT family two-component response regulator|nr:response regulator [Gammaproteobacteria bacterium]MBT3489055.1 response regulator [Gammaproteobacteria bacterium]MBT3719588.1 response regulator [Gammaproteobacteria bacterium]MBT3845710.1 response regulator [Gammaproteobacteria bacterium]MBT3892638.1 response regulator [Gammaproteobacteria bacterium]
MSNTGSFRVLAIDDDLDILEGYKKLFSDGIASPALNALLQSTASNAPQPLQPDSFLDGDHVDTVEWVVDTTTSGQQGVAMIETAEVEEDPYAVIYLDMRMPGGWSGLETARYIRQADRDVRIIVITAFVDENVKGIRDILGDGFVYLRKPYSDHELQQLTRFLAADWNRSRKLSHAMAELKSLNQGKGQFLAMMSQELHDPLAVMLLNGEQLGKSGVNQEQDHLLKQMEGAGKRVLQRINDVLDSTKMGSGRLEIEQYLFSPMTMLNELQLLYSSQAAEAGMSLRIDSGFQSGELRVGDEYRTRRILANLLSNCIKFSIEGEVVLRATALSHQEVQFEVRCNGMGISKTMLDTAFFSHSELGHQSYQGFVGVTMGFSVSIRLAERMGGTLELLEQSGDRASFQLTLPLADESSVKQLAQGGEKPEPVLMELSGNVLILEGDLERQHIIQEALEPSAINVVFVINSAQAIEVALSESFDLLLVDLQAPDSGGMEAVILLRQVGLTSPIEVMVEDVSEGERLMLEDIELDGYLLHPLDLVELNRVLDKHLVHTRHEGEENDLEADPALDESLVALYIERLKELYEELGSAIDQGDWKALWKVVVILLGGGASFGFPEITRLARMARMSLKNEAYSEVLLLTRALEEEVKSTIEKHI